jgi:hypothetical protein
MKADKSTAPRSVADDARVQMGAMSPAFPAVTTMPAPVKDAGKTQMGAMSPAFPPRR